ncbi:hypothetical protein B0H14DRAFT_2584877 [Mycena olivaceomarginata]|nr:hypothetical protein B0H14DRAFT_2584877 [Mycena olivaceomarginata]
MIRDLAALKVPTINVDPVIHTVGQGLGREVQDHVSVRQINWVVEEGGIASDLQVTSKIRGSKAFGTSGDGMTIHHINFEVKHVTYMIAGEDTPITRMLDITSAPNHTSAAQLAGWKQIMQCSFNDAKIEAAGGLDAWNVLSEEEKTSRDIDGKPGNVGQYRVLPLPVDIIPACSAWPWPLAVAATDIPTAVLGPE